MATRKTVWGYKCGDACGYTHAMAAAEKMEQYKFRERPSLIKKAQAIADVRGDNFSEVLRDAVRAYIRTHEHELPPDEQPTVIETDEENRS